MMIIKTTTEKFLQQISKHLSTKKEYNTIEYEVYIFDDSVTMVPYIQVYPDRFHKKSTDMESVIYHVLYHHFPNLLSNEDRVLESSKMKSSFNMYKIKPNSLSQGIYHYVLSVTGKRRKWFRVQTTMEIPK